MAGGVHGQRGHELGEAVEEDARPVGRARAARAGTRSRASHERARRTRDPRRPVPAAAGGEREPQHERAAEAARPRTTAAAAAARRGRARPRRRTPATPARAASRPRRPRADERRLRRAGSCASASRRTISPTATVASADRAPAIAGTAAVGVRRVSAAVLTPHLAPLPSSAHQPPRRSRAPVLRSRSPAAAPADSAPPPPPADARRRLMPPGRAVPRGRRAGGASGPPSPDALRRRPAREPRCACSRAAAPCPRAASRSPSRSPTAGGSPCCPCARAVLELYDARDAEARRRASPPASGPRGSPPTARTCLYVTDTVGRPCSSSTCGPVRAHPPRAAAAAARTRSRSTRARAALWITLAGGQPAASSYAAGARPVARRTFPSHPARRCDVAVDAGAVTVYGHGAPSGPRPAPGRPRPRARTARR